MSKYKKIFSVCKWDIHRMKLNHLRSRQVFWDKCLTLQPEQMTVVTSAQHLVCGSEAGAVTWKSYWWYEAWREGGDEKCNKKLIKYSTIWNLSLSLWYLWLRFFYLYCLYSSKCTIYISHSNIIHFIKYSWQQVSLHECWESTHSEEHTPRVVHKPRSLEPNVIGNCRQCKHCKDNII